MLEFPPITIVMTTYIPPGDTKRKQVILRTAASWEHDLLYEPPIHLHVADDGSRHIPKIGWSRGSVTQSQQKRHGVGASLNKGFAKAFETSPLVLYAVDDWFLSQPFDLRPWAKLLMEREDVGVVRLGPPHPSVTGRVEMLTEDWQGWGLRLDRHDFAFGHRPALYHKRMIDHYGWFAEDASALECERLYNERFVALSSGPGVVLALPHPWFHLESIELSGLEPR